MTRLDTDMKRARLAKISSKNEGEYKPSFAAHLALPGDAWWEYGIYLGEDLLYNFTTKKAETLTDAWVRVDMLCSPREYWVNRASAETVERVYSMLTSAALNAAD